MGIKFFGGPYDGVEAEQAAINQHGITLPVNGDLGMRVFILMPPLENWLKLLRGEAAESVPIYPYERVSTPEGSRFEWPPSGGLEQALLEARLKIHPRALTALSTLSSDVRRSVIGIIAELQKTAPDSWPKQKVIGISDDEPIYLVNLPGQLRAFVRFLDTGEIELFDIMREETLRLFRERYGTVSSAG